jgi:two-component system, cell cycle sensor histidine kinase and response regulator CckA
MAPKTRTRIFEPFFTTKSDKGTGLGLATSYNIVKRYGGDIEVLSAPGEGSIFKVLLPTADPPQASRRPTSLEPAISAVASSVTDAAPIRAHCVLIVDDNSVVLGSTRQLLESLGYEVLCASDGREAVGVYEQHRGQVGVVLLDMVMPILGGRDTFRILRTIDPGVRVLLTSGQVDSLSVSDLMDSGAEGFLPKPLDVDQLCQALDRIFGSSP